jgi:F-type H+-transporting ATPase subunit b
MMFAPQILAAGFNPMTFDASALVLTVITVGGLLFILGKFAWGPILSSIEAREKRIEDAITDAEKDRHTAEGVLRDYNERVKNVEAEVAALKEKGRVEAEAIARDIRTRAEDTAAARVEQAVRDIQAAHAQAQEDVRKEAVTIGMLVATKVVGRSVDGEEQRRLATDVLNNLGAVGSAGDN